MAVGGGRCVGTRRHRDGSVLGVSLSENSPTQALHGNAGPVGKHAGDGLDWRPTMSVDWAGRSSASVWSLRRCEWGADGGRGMGSTVRRSRKRGLMAGAWTGADRRVGEARGARAELVGVPAGPYGGQRRRATMRFSHVPDGGAVRLKEDAPGHRLSSSKMAPSQR
jgi:hypothetical protein